MNSTLQERSRIIYLCGLANKEELLIWSEKIRELSERPDMVKERRVVVVEELTYFMVIGKGVGDLGKLLKPQCVQHLLKCIQSPCLWSRTETRKEKRENLTGKGFDIVNPPRSALWQP